MASVPGNHQIFFFSSKSNPFVVPRYKRNCPHSYSPPPQFQNPTIISRQQQRPFLFLSYSENSRPSPFRLIPLPLLPPPRLHHIAATGTASSSSSDRNGDDFNDYYNSSSSNNNNNNNGKGRRRWWWWWDPFEPDGWGSPSSLHPTFLLLFLEGLRRRAHLDPSLRLPFTITVGRDALGVFLLSLLSCLLLSFSSAFALALTHGSVWEVRGGKWTRLAPDRDSFVVAGQHRNCNGNGDGESGDDGSGNSTNNGDNNSNSSGLERHWQQCRDVFLGLLLPEGYPHSVSSDYLQYSLWRGLQGIASQVTGVLSTQALLYAVGLGKGAIPTAAAINWVLKDGLGYLSKILLSKFGRHFDVNPKGWRLFADFLENAAYGMEILTPAFPQLFVLIGAAAGAGRSAAALIQAATRSCFYAGFAVQRNFAEVIAKGEAQGMVSKFFGITLGIALANYVGSSTPLALAAFCATTGVHMYCNLKSYQSIQLRTLNPYRASLVFSEYLLSGQVPQIKEVNDEEPLFPGLPFANIYTHRELSPLLSMEAKDAAVEICRRLQLGSKFSEVINNREDAFALFDLFRSEGYLLSENQGRFCVVLREGCSPQDMLKSLFHVNYLYWLERNVGMESKSIADECRPGGRLQISLDYVQREFSHIKEDGLQSGWHTDDGLIARPLPNRIRPGYVDSVRSS